MAAIDVNVSNDAQVLEVIQGMRRSSIEIIVRHESPTGGCTAAGINELSPGIAEVLVHGSYDASPLPARSPGDLDVRLISGGDEYASIVMYESGIGILDPLLLDIGLSIPELLPPADVRGGLELQRLLVLEKASIEEGFQPPAVCIAVPFKAASDEEHKSVELAIGQWMAKVTEIFFTDSKADVDSNVGTIPLRGGVLAGIRNHPMVRGASLHWAVSNGALSQRWFIAGTTPGSVRRLRGRLAESSRHEADREAAASKGMVHADHLADVIRNFAEIRKENAGPKDQSDYRVFNVMIDIAGRFKDVKWNFKRQEPQEISGRLELSIPNSHSSSGRVVKP